MQTLAPFPLSLSPRAMCTKEVFLGAPVFWGWWGSQCWGELRPPHLGVGVRIWVRGMVGAALSCPVSPAKATLFPPARCRCEVT